MVQKYQSPVRVYKHPFELVMAVSVLTCTRSQPRYILLVGGRFRGHHLKNGVVE